MMKRAAFKRDGLTLSYLDSGGDGPLIVTLHATWMEARTFESFAQAMPEWRVVSMDQRGHGLSDHSTDYSRNAFVGDIAALLEEGPPESHGPFDVVLQWRGLFPTREALEQEIGERLAWSVAPSFRETAQGWALAFDPADLAAMKEVLNGDYWSDWLATTCPALVVRGTESRAVDGKLLQAMVERRPNTELLSLAAGHVVHHDEAEKFNTAVRRFIEKLD